MKSTKMNAPVSALPIRACALAILVAGSFVVALSHNATAAPVPVDPLNVLTVFDTGGQLNAPLNNGYTLGGLEVDGGTVYVAGATLPVGNNSTSLKLFSSTGMGTAAQVGSTAPIQLNTRSFDLTKNPADGTLNVVGTLTGGAPGIYGFDPAGVAPLTTFATTSATWATSGLTFDAAGTTALVSTDGAGALTPGGLYSVPAGGPETPVVVSANALPLGIGAGTDDHVITLDGRTIVVGDGSHDIWDVSGGAGSVSLLIDLDAAGTGATMGAGGNRAAVDPVTGDIFVTWALPTGNDIVRVKADGSGATRFAIGMPGERIRDLAFGPASDGGGLTNLYVSAAMVNGVGSIYEITTIPEPATVVLITLGALLAGCTTRRRAAR